MRITTEQAENVPSSEYGPRLAAYIDQRRGEMSVREFSRQHGLDQARISTWSSGSRPSWEHLRPVAEGLGLTLGELLVIMGVGRPEDFTVRQSETDVRRAIEADPGLSPDERVMLRDLLAAHLSPAERVMLRDLLGMFDQLRAGQDSVTVSSDTGTKHGRRRRQNG